MVQKKYLFIGIGTVVIVAGLGTTGYVLWRDRPQNTVSFGAASGQDAQDQANAQYSNGQNIPLASSEGGGLSADSSPSAGNLGQLNQNSSSGSANGSNSAQSSTDSGNSSSSQTVDPSTFGQYDKYKNNPDALFGDVQVGTGTELTSGHQATVYYKGWLTNGTLFDQSRPDSSGQLQPFTFTLGAHQVIAGWEEGLAGMKVGGTRLLVVPPAVGYGASGQGSIPGNAVLVFEVQLLSVQ